MGLGAEPERTKKFVPSDFGSGPRQKFAFGARMSYAGDASRLTVDRLMPPQFGGDIIAVLLQVCTPTAPLSVILPPCLKPPRDHLSARVMVGDGGTSTG